MIAVTRQAGQLLFCKHSRIAGMNGITGGSMYRVGIDSPSYDGISCAVVFSIVRKRNCFATQDFTPGV